VARAHGAYAEYTVVTPGVKTEPRARIPGGLNERTGSRSAHPGNNCARCTRVLSVTVGQRLVVIGATGVGGGYAVQMARSRGAHVIATFHGDVEEARRQGTKEVYDTKAVEVIDALRVSHPDGVDIGCFSTPAGTRTRNGRMK